MSSSSSSSPPGDEAPILIAPLRRELDDRARAVRVGAAIIVATVILVGALLVTGPLRLVTGPQIAVDFAFCGPIKPGASVRLAGVVVGVVEDVELLAGQNAEAGPDAMVRVHAHVEQRIQHLLTDKTQFYVTTLGVLGEHYLDIAPAPGDAKGKALHDGARVDGVTLARADLLLPRASALLERADALMPDSPELKRLMAASTTLTTLLADLLSNDDARQAMGDDVAAMRELLADVRLLVRGARVGVGDGSALKDTLVALPPVLASTKALEDEALKARVGDVLGDVQRLAQKTERLVDAIDDGPIGDVATQKKLAAELSTTLRSLDTAARRADAVMRVLDEGKGAGRLWRDDAFAADVKDVVKQVREDPMKMLFK
jgi:ABC-type transporter Mla subunit MlaD